MIVKRYLADNMNEAMMKIRYDLGSQAIIISQRKIKKPGFFGIFSKKVIEVTAALESENKLQEEVKTPVIEKENSDQILEQIKKISEEIKDLKEVKEEDKTKTKTEVLLQNSDMNEKTVKKVVARIKSNKEKISDIDKARSAIENLVPKYKDSDCSRIVLVGPTGVGKTTTIAKLAGRMAIQEKKRVGLITIDTYRIGAVEQLKTYADIIKIPFQVVFNLNDMDKALDKLKDCDAILVDTTGRNSKNLMQLSELRSYIDKVNTDNINLVISATTKNKDINAIISGYKVLNYKNIIITKLDETTTYGSLLNVVDNSRKPINYVTTGQIVPDDILRISAKDIANLILGVDKI
ncbi:MAG: flagellar biosynthesis protein FlhF [Clostridiaceae bacterium]